MADKWGEQKSSGKYVLLQPTPPSTQILEVGDQTANVGPFALAIAKKPELTLHGKFVIASTGATTTGGILKTWGEVTGNETEYVEISLEQFDRLYPLWGQEMGIMLKFWEEVAEKSWSGEEFLTGNDLGVAGPFVGLKEALGTFDWSDL